MNNPSCVYDNLIAELADGELNALQKQVFELLRDNPDGLDRYQLVGRIFGYMPEKIGGNTDDRKIRKAIERLRQRLFPIISTSGKAGYRLDASRESVEKMIRELQSRQAHIQQQIEAASKFYDIPVVYEVDPSEVTQLEMTL